MKLFCRHQPCFEKQCCVGFVFTGVSSVSTLEGKVCFLSFSHLKSSGPADLCVPDSQCDLSTSCPVSRPFSHLLQTLAFASSGPTIKSDTGQHSQFLCWSNLLNLTNDCVCPESSMCSALKAQSSSSFSFISFCFEALCASDLHFKCISYSSFSSSWFNIWIQTYVVFKFKFNVSISLLYNVN